MKNLIYVFLAAISFSCQGDLDLNGEWERIEYSDEEEIPQVISSELGIPLRNDLKIEIFNDSMTFNQKNRTRSVKFRLDKSYLYFPDYKNEYEMKWEIISHEEKSLLIERNIGGIDPFYVRMSLKKNSR